MTYARARLWLGISAVGTVVGISFAAILLGMPYKWFPTAMTWSSADVWSVIGFVLGLAIVMLPFDFIGGYLLPRRFGRRHPQLLRFLSKWITGVALQSTLFVITGLTIVVAARIGGLSAATFAVMSVAIAYAAAQGLINRISNRPSGSVGDSKLVAALDQCDKWGLERVRSVVVNDDDPGFTGGIVGLPGRETMVVPRSWLNLLSTQQLAAVLARRIEAVRSGSRTRGLMLAMLWTVCGFLVSSLLAGGAPVSVAQLVATCLAYTCWTFLGLLFLPSISRQAAYAIDHKVVARGILPEVLYSALGVIDRLQDDEPRRSTIVEVIFHPVPALERRQQLGTGVTANAGSMAGAWHVARMALFMSWSCLGLLSRSVHCNAGRPELWAMLPTD